MARRGKKKKQARKAHKHFLYSQLIFLGVWVCVLLSISAAGVWAINTMSYQQHVKDQEELAKKEKLSKKKHKHTQVRLVFIDN